MDKYFLVVGAGFGQLPAIISAKKIGLKVVAVDRNRDAVGMPLADYAYDIDVVDIDKVVSVAMQHKVCGAMTMQSDIGVPTVGAVVDALKLNGSGRDVAERCSNKILTRQALQFADVPQPRFAVVTDLDEAVTAAENIGYPCVVKAPDSSGSRGVVKVNSKKEVKIAFEEATKYTRGSQILVEDFITGVEIGAQAFSINGRCEHVLVHDDELSSPPFMVPVAHAFPFTLNGEQLEKAKKVISDCVLALGITDGPSNIDLIIDNNGDVKIIEVGVRIGATCLPELVYYHTGVDWVKAAIQSAIGAKPEIDITHNQPCAAYILESQEDGVFEGFSFPAEYKECKDVLEWEITVKPGDLVSRLRKGTDRIGKIITRGNSTEEAFKLAQEIRSKVDIYVKKCI